MASTNETAIDSGWTIVHIDPSPGILTLVRQELTQGWDRPLEISSFAQTEEAARYLLYESELRPNLVIMDAALEHGDATAVELLALVRDCHPSCPVLLTRYPEVTIQSQVLQLPDIHVIEKPFSADALRQTVERLLKCPQQG